MDKKKLRGGLFGYRKKDVNDYIETVVSEYERVMEEQKNEISELKRQNEALIAENAENFQRLEELEKERGFVSKAVISAEMRAKKVMDDTEKEMAELKANKAAEIARADEELKKLREQINSLKSSAVATLKKYEAQMDQLIEEH